MTPGLARGETTPVAAVESFATWLAQQSVSDHLLVDASEPLTLALASLDFLRGCGLEEDCTAYVVRAFESHFLCDHDIHSAVLHLSASTSTHALKSYFAALAISDVTGRSVRSALLDAANGAGADIRAVHGGQGPSNHTILQELQDINAIYRPFIKDLVSMAAKSVKKLSQLPDTSNFYECWGFDLETWLQDQVAALNAVYIASAPISFLIIGSLDLCHYCMGRWTMRMRLGEMRRLLRSVTGHSQGVLVAAVIARSDSWDQFYCFAQLAIELLFWTGFEAIMRLPDPKYLLLPSTTVHLALVNSRANMVVAGPARSLRGLCLHLRKIKADEQLDQSRVPFSERKPVIKNQFLPISGAFHSPILKDVCSRILPHFGSRYIDGGDLSIPFYHTETGEDLSERGTRDILPVLIRMVMTEPVDWLRALSFPKVSHVVDFGPGGIGYLIEEVIEGSGVCVIIASDLTSFSDNIGSKAELFAPSLPAPSPNWTRDHGPRLVKKTSGEIPLDTKMSRLFGCPHVMVAGMTPTTVPWQFVAAVMKIGYHIELAGSGLSQRCRKRIWRGEGHVPLYDRDWSHARGYPSMPFDGVLLGSRMMVAKEAFTSPQAKNLIVQDPAKRLAELRSRKLDITDQLNKDYQRPWFAVSSRGASVEIEDLTYLELLYRLLDLVHVRHQRRWVDESYKALVSDFALRAWDRLHTTPWDMALTGDLQEPSLLLNRFTSRCPTAATEHVHVEDASFFVGLCKRRGQKPVNSIPRLDEHFEHWFKKDSLPQAEDVDAVVNGDAQRVCIIQGPAAVHHSCIVDEPAQSILDERSHRRTHHEALALIETPIEKLKGVTVIQASSRTAYKFSHSGTLPDEAMFTKLLQSKLQGWAKGCLVDGSIGQGQTGEAISFPPSSLSLLRAELPSLLHFRANIMRPQQTLLRLNSLDGKRVSATFYTTNPFADGDIPLRFDFDYLPDKSWCRILENMGMRNDRIKTFYAHLCLGSYIPSLKHADLEAEFYGQTTFITPNMAHDFLRVINSSEGTQAPNASPPNTVPLDLGVVLAWETLVKPLLVAKIDGDLLRLLHYSNSSTYCPGASPLKVGVTVVSTSRIRAVTIRSNGKLVEVVATIRRDSQPVMEVATVLFQDFEINSPKKQALVFSRRWISTVDQSFHTIGKTLLFKLETDVTYSYATTIQILRVRGQISLKGIDCLSSVVGQLYFDAVSCHGNPVMDFLNRHGSPIKEKTPLPNAGREGPSAWNIRMPQKNSLYAKVSKDTNPIHVSPVFAQYAQLPGTVTHGMSTSAAVRRVMEDSTAEADYARFKRWCTSFEVFSIIDIGKTNPLGMTVYFGGKRGGRIRNNYLALKTQSPDLQGQNAETCVISGPNDESSSYTFYHDRGLLKSTQFAQPAFDHHGDCRRHSLGEYSALGAVAQFLPLESLLRLVFYRGLVTQEAMKRDEHGRTDFSIVAVNPFRIRKDFDQDAFEQLVTLIANESGTLLEVVNYNVEGQQYVCVGHLRALWILSEIELHRGAATIPLRGIDVPFDSKFLRGGIGSYRKVLEEKIVDESIDAEKLVGKSIPNVTGMPFGVDKGYVELVREMTGSEVLGELLETWVET
ncbi:MAG: hypothetical protein Q9184_004091 [Pyrenodesmia sp. 2 TL-2023]